LMFGASEHPVSTDEVLLFDPASGAIRAHCRPPSEAGPSLASTSVANIIQDYAIRYLSIARSGAFVAGAVTHGAIVVWKTKDATVQCVARSRRYTEADGKRLEPVPAGFVWLDGDRILCRTRLEDEDRSRRSFDVWNVDDGTSTRVDWPASTPCPPSEPAPKRRGPPPPVPKGGELLRVAFSPDGSWAVAIVSGCSPSSDPRAYLEVARVQEHALVGTVRLMPRESPCALQFAPDSKTLVVASEFGAVYLCPIERLEELARTDADIEPPNSSVPR
jgi:hypothetical protein